MRCTHLPAPARLPRQTRPAPIPGTGALAATGLALLVAFAPVTASDTEHDSAAGRAADAPEDPMAHAMAHDAWFDTIGVSAWPDADGDGYASGLTISLDADTTGDDIDAYARLALSSSSGAERLLYDTSDFRIRGRSAQDRVDIELDLLDAFPSDRYDLVIELRSARNDSLLDVVDRNAFYNLGAIPLEDAYRDDRYGHDSADHGYSGGYSSGYSSDGYSSSSYVAVDYAGAGAPLGLAMLALLAAFRHRPARARRSV